jgi:hypothetical protein
LVTPEPDSQHNVPADLEALADTYRLGELREVRFLPNGRMNRNWFVDAERGRFALKLLTDRDPAVVRCNLGLLDHLAAEGIPVAPAVATIAGDLICEIEGSAYYLCEWIDGTHPGAEMNLVQAGNMGAVIARIHNALSIPNLSLPAPQQVQTTADDPAEALAESTRYLKLAEEGSDSFDQAVAPVLRERRDLIAASAHHRHHRPERLDPRRLPGLQPDLDGRPRRLANAARHRWWRMLTHCWQLGFHYDRNDPTCDDLFFNDHRLLTWWSANLDTVEATFGA